ncbi:MAG: hypothetical protein P8X43_07375, partial [Maritimibacter sp.]
MNSNTAELRFREFIEYERHGLRAKAQVAARALAEALPSMDEKWDWVCANLSNLPSNGAGRIQHQIFQEIV